MQPVKQCYAAKTKRSNTLMNYVTKQKLAATYIQNHLKQKATLQQGDCEVTREVFVSAATRMNNNSRVLTSKIVSYYFFFFSQTYSHSQTKKKETKKGGEK